MVEADFVGYWQTLLLRLKTVGWQGFAGFCPASQDGLKWTFFKKIQKNQKKVLTIGEVDGIIAKRSRGAALKRVGTESGCTL
jgi:hypothetical protein